MLPLATLYDWLLFLHIVAAIVWVGGLILVVLLVIAWDMVFKPWL